MPKGLPDISDYQYTHEYELAIPLIDSCNMSCDFCFENQKGKITEEENDKIMSILPRVISYMKPIIKNGFYNRIDLKLWGGELFFDALPDWIFDTYRKFISELKKELPIPFTIVFLSNGVFEKYNRIDKLLEEVNGNISISYDPVGRYKSNKQREMFLKSLEHFKKTGKLESVSVTLTKPTMRAYVAGDKIYDTYIPDNLQVIVNFYVPNSSWKEYVPSCEDYYLYYKWAIENHHFNIDVINNIMTYMIPEQRKSVRKMCNCKEATQYVPWINCCSDNCINDRILDMDYKKFFYGKYNDEVTRENHFEVRSSLSRIKNHCLYCEHFKYCPMMCPTSIVFSEYDASYCPIKKVYQDITSEQINAFKEWQQKYRLFGGE